MTPVEQLVLLALLRLHNTVHRKIDRRMPRKTGRLRSNVVASSGVNDNHPGGYPNRGKRLECEINFGSRQFAVNARRITTDGTDHARVWEIVNKNNANRYTIIRVERRGPARSSR